MRKTGFSTAAFIIAFVLAKNAEVSYRQSLLLSDNGAAIFFERPVVIGLLLVGIAVVASRGYASFRARQRERAEQSRPSPAG